MNTKNLSRRVKIKSKRIKPALLLAVILVVFTLISNSDFEHEMRQEAHYKEMVCSGAWENYKNSETDCKKVGK